LSTGSPSPISQVERMNRTLKEAIVKRYHHYESNDQLQAHLDAFLAAYNFAKRLKTLRSLTPHGSSAKPGQKIPKISESIRSLDSRGYLANSS
jgi:hypothetical protein